MTCSAARGVRSPCALACIPGTASSPDAHVMPRRPWRRVNHSYSQYMNQRGSAVRSRGGGVPGPPKPETTAGGVSISRIPLLPLWRAPGRSLWSAAQIVTAGPLVTMGLGAAPAGAHTTAYRQINLVSDQAGKAPLTDPDLVNAWGLAASPGTNAQPGSPVWVADNGTD